MMNLLRYAGTLSIVVMSLGSVGCKDTAEEPKPPGEKWMVFTTANSGLVSNNIVSLGFDASGRKWIGTSEGVSQFAQRAWRTFTTSDGLANNRVTAIAPGRDASLWFGTGGSGVSRYIEHDPRQVWRTYTVALDHLPDGFVYSLAIDYFGDAWIGTNGGVGQFVETPGSATHAGVWHTYGTGEGLPEVRVTAVAVDLNNVKWFGTSFSGLASFDGGAWQPYPVPQGERVRTTSIATDANGVKWIGTWSGALRFDGSNWTVYDSTDGLASNMVNSVTVEAGTTIWFATDRGVSRLSGSTWTTFTRANSILVSDTVTVVAADISRNVWFGTPSGVTVYNENGIQL